MLDELLMNVDCFTNALPQTKQPYILSVTADDAMVIIIIIKVIIIIVVLVCTPQEVLAFGFEAT